MVGGDPMKRFMVGLLGFVLVWLFFFFFFFSSFLFFLSLSLSLSFFFLSFTFSFLKSFRLEMTIMTLDVHSPVVYTKVGVLITVGRVAQVIR